VTQVDVARFVRPGDTVAWGQAAAEPLPLTRALMTQRHAVGGRFAVFIGATWSDTLRPEFADAVDFRSYCGTAGNRFLSEAGVLDVMPCPYSQLVSALGRGPCRVDVLLLQVAPPGPEGHYSLAISHEYLVPLIDSARVVIAEVNEQAPWTHGTRALKASDFDAMINTSRPPLELRRPGPTPIDSAVAAQVAALIDDASTLQLGVGALPEAVLQQLTDRRDIGIHSGTIGDGVAELSERGVITNARKTIDRGVTIAGTMMGSRRIHAFAHRNAGVQFRPTTYTHDLQVLSSIDKLVALNSAIEVDLSGQINAEVAGGRYVGAVGGAPDFLRGAQLARGGLPIVALPSRAGGKSRIVRCLNGPVSTPRSDAGAIVTEYGVADLRGLSLSKRAERLIAIAHPEDRAHLERPSPIA
jgi:acyl-CoA hydrolase